MFDYVKIAVAVESAVLAWLTTVDSSAIFCLSISLQKQCPLSIAQYPSHVPLGILGERGQARRWRQRQGSRGSVDRHPFRHCRSGNPGKCIPLKSHE